MNPETRYIKVILPLKLEWEPFYRVPDHDDEISVGDRVLVPFAGRSYLGVVSQVDAKPEEDALPRIREAYGIDRSKDGILPSEIKFWRMLSVYYLCSVGEVYKAAYPCVKDELVTPRKKNDVTPDISQTEALNDVQKRLSAEVNRAFNKGKTVLLDAPDAESVALNECLKRKDGTVLWLVPQLKEEKALRQRLEKALGQRLILWGSNLTAAKKREAMRRVRSGENCVILGTRSAVFLPLRNLSLAIIRNEQDTAYKQTSPSPRYNGRDAAILLASSMGANILLCSRTPSFEMMFNCISGRYALVKDIEMLPDLKYEIIDTRAETLKRGMVGILSRKLIGICNGGEGREGGTDMSRIAVFKSRKSMFPTTEELLVQISSCLGPDVSFSDDVIENPLDRKVSVIAFFGVDSLLGRNDFRSDEHCLQQIRQVILSLPALKKAVIQTANATHPVFKVLQNSDLSPMLEERRQFGYPPYSRIIDILFKDSSPQRLALMSSSLAGLIRDLGGCRVIASKEVIRLTIPRDGKLQGFKLHLKEMVSAFEKERKYMGHITFDVDPV